MTVTTDGRMVVWCIFNSDGCECSDLVGVFETEDEANKVADNVRELIQKYHREHMRSEWLGSVDVIGKILGEYQLPADARMTHETLA